VVLRPHIILLCLMAILLVQTHILSGNIDADASERELWCYKVLRVAMETWNFPFSWSLSFQSSGIYLKFYMRWLQNLALLSYRKAKKSYIIIINKGSIELLWQNVYVERREQGKVAVLDQKTCWFRQCTGETLYEFMYVCMCVCMCVHIRVISYVCIKRNVTISYRFYI